MNERLKELAEQAGMHYRKLCDEFAAANTDGVPFEMMERFAELIRLDETKACAKHYLSIMRDAVEQAVLKERAACVKLCENVVSNEGYVQAKYCAAAIRARGEK